MKRDPKNSRRPNDGAANLAMLKRTVKKLFSYYPVLAPVTFACILFSAIVTSIPSLFVQNVIQVIEKWYVSRDWVSAKAELIPILSLLISLYVLSIIAILVYKQLMAYMTQGFLDKLRQEMFGGMQDLPIRYFDTHQHGDIMSFYTNDIDTLRQLVSEAIPAFIQSGAIVLAVFGIMLYFSIWLTLISVLGVILMIVVTKRVGGGSAKFFLRQQQAVAKTEGYIQETMTGQKVVKVFCHEQRSIEEFDKINDALFEDSYRAHAYASVLGPIIGNIGNFLYVALALVGGVLLLIGVPNLSLSGKALDISILVPFLNMTKQFTGNINQLSQQINSIVMAGRPSTTRQIMYSSIKLPPPFWPHIQGNFHTLPIPMAHPAETKINPNREPNFSLSFIRFPPKFFPLYILKNAYLRSNRARLCAEGVSLPHNFIEHHGRRNIPHCMFFSMATASRTYSESVLSCTPTTLTEQRLTGIRIFLATHSETAAAIFGVISPQSAFAKIMPMGPTMTSAHVQFTTTGFSPVAAASAPARSMALVARLFVPTATTSTSGMFFLIWSVSAAPILPP